MQLVHLGSEAPYRTRHISMRGVFVRDLIHAEVVTFVPTGANPSDASTKGLGNTKVKALRKTLCLCAQRTKRPDGHGYNVLHSPFVICWTLAVAIGNSACKCWVASLACVVSAS
eukprot:6492778-Amphidinium_carterae.2